jgi:flagellar biosynthesis/type III secretory pathway chaperone
MSRSAAVIPMPTRDEAGHMVDRIVETVERLNSIMQRETELIRAAKLKEAGSLVEDKATLAGVYQRELEAVRAAASAIGRLVPDRAEILRHRLAGLQETLSVNLAVVGTARAVAEDMMRTVADEVSRQSRPSVYGQQGQVAPVKTGPASISISRRS